MAQFKNALWVSGFPEREDDIHSGTLTTALYIKVHDALPSRSAAPFRPLMCELISQGAARVFRGSAIPAADTASLFVAAGKPVRFELSPVESIYIKRVGTDDIIYSIRSWIRE